MNTLGAIDSNAIFNAITGANYPAAATELGAELVDAWVAECQVEDQRYRTLLIEGGFYFFPSPKLCVVGACDRVMEDTDGALFEETKTTGNKKSKTYGPEQWFDNISEGHQIGVYGAGMRDGTFVWREVEDGPFITARFNAAAPRVLVRAVTKFKPCEIWPTPAGAIIEITPRKIETTLNVVRNAAASIRAMRKSGLLPWSLPTHQCVKVYGFTKYPCNFLDFCKRGEYVTHVGGVEGLSPGSSEVVQYLIGTGQLDPNDSETVILSSSSLEDWMWCGERFRRRAAGEEKESKSDFDIGSVVHIGLEAYRRQMQAQGY